MWLYLLSVIVSYFFFRLYLKYDKDAECNPILLLIFLIFIPIFNIGVSLGLLIITNISRLNIKLDYKKIFMIK